MTEKRYQIFISSTFEDLKDERRSAIRAILEMNHIPAGMELFPASDDAAWSLIQGVIRESDYYVIIIGGRYGSLDENGISYTEKEYDYAAIIGIPVVPLLYRNPDNLPRGKTETSEGAWKKLQEFRGKVERNHTCKYWESAEDLEAKLVLGVTHAIKRHLCVGWIRANTATSKETLQKLEEARERILQLEQQLKDATTGPPPGTDNLAFGDEKISIRFRYRKSNRNTELTDTLQTTWNQIVAIIGPHMIREASERHLIGVLHGYITEKMNISDVPSYHFNLVDEDFQAVKIQLLALGIMQKSNEKHTASDTATYWSLTRYGETYLLKLRAIRTDNTGPGN